MSSKSIYVIGPPRSGSTLVYNILCSSDATNNAINETHVLPELASLCSKTAGRLEIEQGHIFSDQNECDRPTDGRHQGTRAADRSSRSQ